MMNLATIKAEIEAACKRVGRDSGEVTLVGVTKNRSVQEITQMRDAGIKIAGENRVQEFLPKYEALGNSIEWHFIGHLQRNKVRQIIDKVQLIHSVDSLRLAEEISRQAKLHGRNMNILIEINIAEEESKHGISPSYAKCFFRDLQNIENVTARGLMCIAPFQDPQDVRKYFGQMKQIQLDITRSFNYHGLTILSMGMSSDFFVAIEEGATMIRLGTVLFANTEQGGS